MAMPLFSDDLYVERFVAVQAKVFCYIATLLPNRSDAEDLFQQVALLLWQQRQQYDPARDFLPWALGIAHNEVRNFFRKKSRRGLHLSDGILDKLSETRHAAASRLESLLGRLEDCLARLTDEQRELVEACYLSDAPIKAIAAERNVDPAAFYKRLDRIRWILMDCIEGADEGEVSP